MKWVVDNQALAVLRDMGIESEVVSDINIKERVNRRSVNGAREKPIDQDLVDDYVHAMKAGDSFPCLVLAEIDDQKTLTVSGGNHRLEAAVRRGAATITAIVCRVSRFEFQNLSKRLNVVNGKRETRTTRIEHGISLVTEQKLSQDEACRIAGVSKAALVQGLKFHRLRIRALECNLTAARSIQKSCATAFGDLTENDDLFPLLYAAAAAPGCTTDAMKDLCREVRRCGSLSKQKELIEETRQTWEQKKKIQKKAPVACQLRRLVTGLKTLAAERTTLASLQMTAEDAKALVSDLEGAASILKTAISRS